MRSSLACLHRRTTILVRSSRSLQELLTLLQCFHHFAPADDALRVGGVKHTPTMQAGLVAKVLSLQELFMSTASRSSVSRIVDEDARSNWGASCTNNS
jgi:hypothetical protein